MMLQRLAARCLMLPGSGPAAGAAIDLYKELHSALGMHGINTTLLSKYDHGSIEKHPVSYFEEYVKPLWAPIDGLTSGPEERPSVLIGHSLGGHVAPMVAAHLRWSIPLVLINANFDSLLQVARWQARQRAWLTGSSDWIDEALRGCSDPKSVSRQYRRLTSYLRQSETYHPSDFTSTFKNQPVLCVNSSADRQLPPEQNQKWKTAFYSADADLKCIEYTTLDHIGRETSSPHFHSALRRAVVSSALINDIAEWICHHI